MKTFAKIIIPAIMVLAVFSACKSAPKFSDITGKEWRLIEIRTDPRNIIYDRKDLEADGYGNIFTLNFDAERLSGTGAPNRYMAPYTLGEDQSITVQPIAGTLMAAFREPERLKEHDYFTYMENVYKWNYDKKAKQMELYSKNANEKEAVLVYSLGKAK